MFTLSQVEEAPIAVETTEVTCAEALVEAAYAEEAVAPAAGAPISVVRADMRPPEVWDAWGTTIWTVWALFAFSALFPFAITLTTVVALSLVQGHH